ncbi:hypothetical protein KUTeg_019668 [Tegillarca granosa]|uniref:Uncharacterized protein n=1 Tax=Tegillarca granosa TaxID=220873 RepID=A0ABQ9EH92_TEGGR|nr:hypothetical protein KUTeg_019668 [Tegillarca granosa]
MKWTSSAITMKVYTMLYKIEIIYLFMQINLVVLFILPNVSCDRLENDLRLLSKILPGIYNNRHQYYNDIKNNVPSDRRHLSVQTIFRPVQIEFIPDAYNVYVEQYLNNENAPFKQWFYSFKTDETGVAIKMKIFNLLKSSVRQKIFKNIKNIAKLSADDMSSNSGCDMFWRRLKGKTFVGATGRRCLANFKGEQVRVAISGTLTPSSFQWNEGWYSTEDGRGFVELLRNMKVFRDGTALVDIYTIDPHHDQVVRQSMAVCKLHKRIGHFRFVTSSMEKLRTVKNFGSLRSSLRKGKPVRMIADLSKCSGGNGINPIIGGEFRDYDFLRSGETIEFHFERYATNSNSENIITSRHVTGQFSRDNSAIFTLTDEDNTQNRYDNLVGIETRYRCQMGKNGSAKGLKIYHTGNK